MKQKKRSYSGLFHAAKHEKISDKAFSRILFSSVTGVLLCLICLAALTWAWFDDNAESTVGAVRAATFSIVELDADGNIIQNGVTLQKESANSAAVENPPLLLMLKKGRTLKSLCLKLEPTRLKSKPSVLLQRSAVTARFSILKRNIIQSVFCPVRR